MRYKFEELNVWQISMQVTKLIYGLSSHFPDNERFGLTNQVRRAAVSITLNIAEGTGRSTNKDFASFVRNAIGSALEVVACIKIAKQQKFLEENQQALEDLLQELYFKLVALDKALRK